jgi:hypothetical protein
MRSGGFECQMFAVGPLYENRNGFVSGNPFSHLPEKYSLVQKVNIEANSERRLWLVKLGIPRNRGSPPKLSAERFAAHVR